MKHLAKSFFLCVLLTLGPTHANAALMHFVADASQSQFTGNLSLDGQISVTSVLGSDTKTVSGAGVFAGSVAGTIDADVDTSGGTFGFQGLALSSPISGSLSTNKTVLKVPVTIDVAVTKATVDLASPSSSSALTYTGSGGIYSWGPTAMTLNISVDYTATLSVSGNSQSISDTASFSVPLTDATGTVTLDGVGNPIAYVLGIPGNLVIQLPLSTTSGLYTVDFTGTLTLNNLSLNLQGTSTVVPPPAPPPTPVPVPAAFYLFGSGLLVLLGLARRKSG